MIPHLDKQLHNKPLTISPAGPKNIVLSQTKPRLVYFCRIFISNQEAHLSLQGDPLTTSSQATYLGLILHTKLNWKAHVNNLKTSCQRDLMYWRNWFIHAMELICEVCENLQCPNQIWKYLQSTKYRIIPLKTGIPYRNAAQRLHRTRPLKDILYIRNGLDTGNSNLRPCSQRDL